MIKQTNKSIDGTSFHGATITASLADLIDVLGAPHGIGEQNDKVQNEWEFELEDGVVFTLYDWKEYRRYSDTESIEWHIGSHNALTSLAAQEALEEALDEGTNINEQTKTDNMSSKPSLFQSVKDFINSYAVGHEFTTKEFHAALEGKEFITGWKKYSAGNYYRQDQYKGYLRRLGFVDNPKRGVWRVLCDIPTWLNSGHVNLALGYISVFDPIQRAMKFPPYDGMTKEEVIAKINDYIYHNGIIKMVEQSPKVEAQVKEIDPLDEYKNDVKKLATQIIGDGKSPNIWFVTKSPYFMRYKDGHGDFFLLPDSDPSNSQTYGPFYTYQDACDMYDSIELDHYDEVGTVTIEDRKIGAVKEKFLEERITVDYSYGEIDNSKFYNNK
jgi:hypothetical protein